VYLADWVMVQGADASLYPARSDEDWVVVFNPKCISGYRKVPAAEMNFFTDVNFPSVKEQLASCQ
jgi:hypothetical protein